MVVTATDVLFDFVCNDDDLCDLTLPGLLLLFIVFGFFLHLSVNVKTKSVKEQRTLFKVISRLKQGKTTTKIIAANQFSVT